jgi:hypothetical protein
MCSLPVLAVLNIVIAPTVITFPPSVAERSAMMAVFDAIRAIQPYNVNGRLRFWYDNSDQSGLLFRRIASTDLWEYRLVSEDFPHRTDPMTRRDNSIGPGDTVAILSSTPDSVDVAAKSLRWLGLRADVLHQVHIVRGPISIYATFVRLQPLHSWTSGSTVTRSMKR